MDFWYIHEPSNGAWSAVKKNDKNESGHCRPEQNDALVSHYEQLRGDALAESVGYLPATGVALFYRQGMAAWMRAWFQCTQKADGPTVSRPPIREPLPRNLRTQLATVLAEIIIAVQEEIT